MKFVIFVVLLVPLFNGARWLHGIHKKIQADGVGGVSHHLIIHSNV